MSHTHKAVEFPWAENISALNMTPVGMFIASHRNGCEECTHKYAREALQNPDEISAFLGSAYAWALRQTKATSTDLLQPPEDEDGEPLFRDASAALLRLGEDGQIAEMLIWGREAPTSVRVDVLNDAGTAYGLEKSALWTSTPEATPPPWVETLGPALAYVDRMDHQEDPEPQNSPSAP
ncbi:MAG TPA: hypothetical protein VK054_06030, partial [Beutenbergiaceae bacterium]|nr:hypothetical protein [Beutenbergiaceae bacterium]